MAAESASFQELKFTSKLIRRNKSKAERQTKKRQEKLRSRLLKKLSFVVAHQKLWLARWKSAWTRIGARVLRYST